METLQRLYAAIVMSNDEAFEAKLGNWVPQLLQHLESNDASIRDLVLEMVNHVLKRTRGIIADPKINLGDLFDCIKNSDSILTLHLTLTFLRLQLKATPELSPDSLEKAMRLLEGVTKRVRQNQLPLIGFLLRFFPQLSRTKSDLISSLNLTPEDKDALLPVFLDLFLLPPWNSEETSTKSQNGLSEARVSDLYKHIPNLDPKKLSTLRLSVLRFLRDSGWDFTQIYPIFVVASVASTQAVQGYADTEMKKMKRDVNYEDKKLVDLIYRLWLGKKGKKVPVKNRVPPVSSKIRIALLDIFTRSKLAANSFPQSLKLGFECLHGDGTFLRLQQGGVDFLCWCFQEGSPRRIKPLVQVYQQGLMKIINAEDRSWEFLRLRGMAYGCLGLLCHAVPDYFIKSLRLFNLFLGKLSTEEGVNSKQCLKDALKTIKRAYAKAPPEILQNLNEALRLKLDDPEIDHDQAYVCLDWLVSIFPFSDPFVRITCVRFLGHQNGKLTDLAERSLMPQIGPKGLDPYPKFSDFVSAAFSAIFHEKHGFSELQVKKILLFSKQCFTHPIITDKKDAKTEWEAISDTHSAFFDICKFALGKFDCNPDSGPSLHSTTLSCIRYFCNLEVATRFCKMDFVTQLLYMIKMDGKEARIEGSQLLGVLAPELSQAIVSKAVSDLTSALSASDASVSKMDGCIHGLGQLLGAIPEWGEAEVSAIKLVVKSLNSDKDVLMFPTCVAIKCIANARPIPMAEDESEREKEVELVIKRCMKLVKANLEQKRDISEAAVECLASISSTETSEKLLSTLRKDLTSLESLKEEDIQFAIGDALAKLVTNKTSVKHLPELIEYATAKIRTGSALQRQSSCVWLLSLTNAAKTHSQIQKYLPTMQDSFLPLLAESRQFTSECAAKGLAFCYESGDAKMKKRLVESLRETFTKGRRVIRDNTDIQTSKGLRTFQELSDIAVEMRDPSFLYKLLDIAGTHAAWTSKRGAAYSLGSLLTMCDELAPQLESLIPKLFRYRFDPNKMINNTMTQLWRSLVKDPVRATREHHVAIMEDCMKCLKSRQVRVLIAASNAIVDLLDGKQFNHVKDYLLDLWKLCLDTTSHHQETVVKASTNLMKCLQRLTKRFADPANSTSNVVRETLSMMIDYLLKGFSHPKKQGRFFTIMTVLQIIDVSREYLVPHLPEVMRTIVEAIGICEPAFFSWYAVQGDYVDNKQKETVDEIRGSASKANPLNDALWKLERVMTKEALDPVVKECCRVVHKSAGFGAVGACCRLLETLLIGRFKEDFKSHERKIINVFCPAILSVNSGSIRKLYASVLGKICILAEKNKVHEVANIVYEAFVDQDGEQGVKIALTLAEALIRDAHHSLPGCDNFFAVIFFGCAHPDKAIRERFESLRAECGGNYMLLSKYGDAAKSLIFKLWANDKYEVAKMGIKAMDNLVIASKDRLTREDARSMVDFIFEQLQGHLWDGKEAMFLPLTSLSKSGVLTDEDFTDVLFFLQQQIIRKKHLFQCAALNCFTEVAGAWENPGKMELLATTVPLLNSVLEEKANLLDDDNFEERREKSQEVNNLRCCTYRTLGRIWRCDQSADAHEEFAADALESYSQEFRACDWTVKISLLKGLENFLESVLAELKYGKLTDLLCEFGLGAQRMPIRLYSVKCLHALLKYKRIKNGSPEVMKIIIGAGQLHAQEDKELVLQALNELIRDAKTAFQGGTGV